MASAERVTVVGTAGHVDHGKSALVRALTGIDPDRLAEEKARGLTIDLGFAWLELPSKNLVSFVDVPGHEDFIRNMLAGAGSVDACLLVVAADEGPMPQTHEHLAILDLLHLDRGAVAITKTDLVDEEWLALVLEEVAELLQGTSLSDAPILPVSAVDGRGLPELVSALDRLVDSAPEPADHGRARLAVDRAFTLSGFGTVITGTLRDGSLEPGQNVDILPGERKARTRSLQSHGQDVERAQPGRRTAINVTGPDVSSIERGDVIAAPGCYLTTQHLDANVRLLADSPAPVAHDDEVHFFHGAAEIPARVAVIGENVITPGSRGSVQLHLSRPTVLVTGDRFVLRRPSPPATIGGGVVLDPHPIGRRRRFRDETLERYEALATGEPLETVWYVLAEREPAKADELRFQDTALEPKQRDEVLHELESAGRVRRCGEFWMTDRGWDAYRDRSTAVVRDYHRRHPLRTGIPSEELRQRVGLPSDAFVAFLEASLEEKWLERTASAIHMPGWQVSFDESQEQAADRLLARYRAQPFSPPSEKEAVKEVGPQLVEALIERGDLVAVGGDVLFAEEAYGELRAAVDERLDASGQVTVADVRDRFSTSRKYALALLEHLDRIRVTERRGDVHVRSAAPAASGDRAGSPGGGTRRSSSGTASDTASTSGADESSKQGETSA